MVQFCAVTVAYENDVTEFSTSGSGDDILQARRNALAGTLDAVSHSLKNDRYHGQGPILGIVGIRYWGDFCHTCSAAGVEDDYLDDVGVCPRCEAANEENN